MWLVVWLARVFMFLVPATCVLIIGLSASFEIDQRITLVLVLWHSTENRSNTILRHWVTGNISLVLTQRETLGSCAPNSHLRSIETNLIRSDTDCRGIDYFDIGICTHLLGISCFLLSLSDILSELIKKIANKVQSCPASFKRNGTYPRFKVRIQNTCPLRKSVHLRLFPFPFWV